MKSNQSKVPDPLRTTTGVISILAALLTIGISLAGLKELASQIWLVLGGVIVILDIYIFSLRNR